MSLKKYYHYQWRGGGVRERERETRPQNIQLPPQSSSEIHLRNVSINLYQSTEEERPRDNYNNYKPYLRFPSLHKCCAAIASVEYDQRENLWFQKQRRYPSSAWYRMEFAPNKYFENNYRISDQFETKDLMFFPSAIIREPLFLFLGF